MTEKERYYADPQFKRPGAPRLVERPDYKPPEEK